MVHYCTVFYDGIDSALLNDQSPQALGRSIQKGGFPVRLQHFPHIPLPSPTTPEEGFGWCRVANIEFSAPSQSGHQDWSDLPSRSLEKMIQHNPLKEGSLTRSKASKQLTKKATTKTAKP